MNEFYLNSKQRALLNKIIITSLVMIVFVIFNSFYGFTANFKFIFFLILYFFIGYDIVLQTLKNIVKLNLLDEKSLMFIATIGAFFLKQYFEAVSIFLLYQIGELFQNIAIFRSKNQISSALQIRPLYANLKEGNFFKKVSPLKVMPGDTIVVKPGERVPLDGVVLSGGSFLDSSSITGESNFLSVGPEDFVLSGVVNISGALEIKVTKKYEESTVKKVLNLIENVSSKKSKTENLIKKFAKIYTPSVVIAAFLIFIIPTLFAKEDWHIWLERCLIFLVISCPCALVISIPVSFFLAISKAAKNRILVKGSIFLEMLANVKVAIFDKTGTLTKGKFAIKEIHSFNNLTKEEVLEIICLAESKLNHPIAKSIKEAYGKPLNLNRVEKVKEIFGKGVKALVDEKEVFVGNFKLLKEIGISSFEEDELGTNVHLVVEKRYCGRIVLQDEVKSNVAKALKNIKKNGVEKVIMLTGDKKVVGENVAKNLNLDYVFCELLPYEKVEKLEIFLKNRGEKDFVMFIGDGVNDAASLKLADVGVAMGAIGSDAAMEACDVVLMDDDINKINIAILISKNVIKTVKQNIVFSLSFKGLIFVLGIFGLTNIWLAIFSDVGVSILAILNAFRAFKGKF